jgi:hypothetical protein
MPLIPSNDPDIALAEDWLADLETWLEDHGTAGPDPFDVKAHPLMRSVQEKPVLRRASTVLCDMAPHLSRKLLRIAPTENPKTHALLATGRLRLYQLTGDAPYRDAAEGHLRWLLDHACADYSGLCWGYPFPIRAQGLDTEAGTPICVIGAIAGEAFLLAHEINGAPEYLDAAISIAAHFLNDVPIFDSSTTASCFHYGPEDGRRVHNANLLVAQHLMEVAVLTDDESMARSALRAVQFSLDAQRQDGAFPYGDYRENDPYEAGLLSMVDNHHSGFVLRSLTAINCHAENKVISNALRRGYRYYKTDLLGENGMPRTEHGAFPVNIHACAEAVLCPAALSREVLGAKKQSILALRWAWSHMRNPKDGAPYYRKYKGFTSEITHPRWGVAWMYRAMAEYLWRCGGVRSGV